MPKLNVVTLNTDEIMDVFKDARIVALRWDLIPWGLVLDLDSPLDESVDAPRHRVWIVFFGISEVSVSLEAARLANGIHVVGWMSSMEDGEGFQKFTLPILAARFDSRDVLVNNPHKELTVTVKKVFGAASVATCRFGGKDPDYKQRQLLASDAELLEHLSAVMAS